MQASEMNLDQCHAWLRANGVELTSDPLLVMSLDAAAAAMPERFTQSIEQYETGWTAKAMSWDCTLNTGVIEADTELLARFRLAVACRMAMKEKA